MQEKKKSEKSKDTLSVILEQGTVKMYHALDITGYMANYFERKHSPECWILFQECPQCEDVGVTEIDISGEKFTVPKKMDLQEIYCILYRAGEYYRLEKVSYNTESNTLDLMSLLEQEKYFKKKENVSSNLRCLSGRKYRNLYANHNGFFVEGLDYGKEVLPWELETKVCYRPNTKVINERVIDRITYRIDSNDQEKDME